MAAHVGGDDYRCPKCGEVKPASDFYKAKAKRSGLSHRCKECHREHKRTAEKAARRARGLKKRGRKIRWTEELIVAAIREWAERFGHPPTSDDWKVNVAPHWPTTGTVQKRFGSWSAGIAAAGFTPLRAGERRG